MRTTKTLAMSAAVLAAGLAAASAQVYSANVVGYVNKAYTGGSFYMVTPPLDAGTNTLDNLLPNPPVASTVLIFDPAIQDFSASYVYQSGSWGAGSLTFPTGSGIFFSPSANWTNTFVGNVPQGAITNVTIVPGASIIGSPVPIAGKPAAIMTNYVATVGDSILKWDIAAQDFVVSSVFQGGTSWLDAGGTLTIDVAEGFLYVSGAASPVKWTRNFTVQ